MIESLEVFWHSHSEEEDRFYWSARASPIRLYSLSSAKIVIRDPDHLGQESHEEGRSEYERI